MPVARCAPSTIDKTKIDWEAEILKLGKYEPTEKLEPKPMPGSTVYEVRQVPGKGYGCFAINTIPAGTRIIAETALIMVSHQGAYYSPEEVLEQFDKLSVAEKDLFFSLASSHGRNNSELPAVMEPGDDAWPHEMARRAPQQTVLSTFATNCIGALPGTSVFPYMSRFNHSCAPNACFVWNSNLSQETLHAWQDIPAGEEICITYVDFHADRVGRQFKLDKFYGFTCACATCEEEKTSNVCSDETVVDPFASDLTTPKTFVPDGSHRENRLRLAELRKVLAEFVSGPLFFKAEVVARDQNDITALEEYAHLLKKEGDHGLTLAAAYRALALAWEQQNELAKATSFAESALRTVRLSAGDDFPEFPKHAELLGKLRSGRRSKLDNAASATLNDMLGRMRVSVASDAGEEVAVGVAKEEILARVRARAKEIAEGMKKEGCNRD